MIHENASEAELLALLPDSERKKLLRKLSQSEVEMLLYDWKFWARKNQLPPEGDWRYWLILAGRGFGKTRTGAEWIRDLVESGRAFRVGIVGRTAADVRDIMVEGESGLLAVSRPDFMPVYQPSRRLLTWPNGATAHTYTGEEPDLLRGPQHDAAWGDEVASWKKPDALDMLFFGLRLGDDPRAVFTTTPRPVKHLKELLKDPHTVTVKGSTYENLANLAPQFADKIIRRYEGTRLGRQEIHAELLEDNPSALWHRANIEETRRTKHPTLTRVVVAIDPGTSEGEDSAETGIVVAGVGPCDCKGKIEIHGFVLDDLTLQSSPQGWATEAITGYNKYSADRIVAEANQGGDMIEHTLRTVNNNIPYKKVHASRNKQTRAEPIAALYEQGRVHHVGSFADLEDQMCNWVPGEKSPDRMDALVWALTELMLTEQDQMFIV
jgi:phage terminase large subunit-like protein